VLEDDTTPPELYALGQNGERRALTELNKSFTEQYELPRQEVIRWRSDDYEIEGILVYPPEGVESRKSKVENGEQSDSRLTTHDSRLPLIVQVHGGPKGRVVNTLRSYNMHPVWAAEGYLVLKPNFRGSEGYGSVFAVANRRDLGGGDFRDIMAGVDELIRRGLADPKRMGIMGGSYGGYMTNWAVSQTDRFAAAVSMFGIFSLVTDYSNSEISRWDRDYLGGYYWEDPEIYRRCSPATYLERINTPVLILHGESDGNTFLSNSKEMYRALRERGATVQFVRYPREGHGLREPNHKLDEMRRCLGWFDLYLKNGGAIPPVRRVGDRIEHEGYELHVLRAEDAEYLGHYDEDGRLLEVAFAIASEEPVESGWTFALADARLTGPDGADCPLRGIPVDAGGVRVLVEGTELTATVQPDKETGRLSLALAAAFEISREGGAFALRIADFPPVAVTVGPKEEKEEEGESGREGEGTISEPPPPTGEEPPAETPQRPDTETG
jgi:dienelactone hydrolase